MTKIAYRRPDGGVSIVVPAPLARLVSVVERGGEVVKVPAYRLFRSGDAIPADVRWAETEEEFLARVRAKDVPSDAVAVVEVDDVPMDRTFRDAWDVDDSGVSVNMTMARDIQMGRIREARNAKLAETDVEVTRAVESGGDFSDVVTRRQRLRDIPQTFDLTGAKTPEELKALWPDELTGTSHRQTETQT